MASDTATSLQLHGALSVGPPPAAVTGRARGLVIVGCSQQELGTADPLPALDLYQDGGVPQLRQRIGASPGYRARTLVLSARHGLVGADTPIAPYDHCMTPERAAELREPVRAAVRDHLATYPAEQALLLLEPDYLDVLGPLPVPVVHSITDAITYWHVVSTVLDGWAWP